MCTLFNKTIQEELIKEAKSEKEQIEKEIANIKASHGEVAEDTIKGLLDIVKKYSIERDKIRKTWIVPSKPKPPTKQDPSLISAYESKLKNYVTKRAALDKQLEKNNQDKLDELSVVVDQVKNLTVPSEGECQLEYVLGNSNVGTDTIIINFSSAHVCQAARAKQCELYLNGFCYAVNNERQHPLAIIKRYREQLQWQTMADSTMAAQIAAVVLAKKSSPIKFVRFNESGDFGNNADKVKLGNVVKMTNEILEKQGHKPITFYTYTHRKDLFPNGNDIESGGHLIIQGSGNYDEKNGKRKPFFVNNCFMGIDYTNAINLIREHKIEELTGPEGLNLEFAPKSQVVMCRGACMNCNYCKTATPKMILVIYHGTGTKLTMAGANLTKQIKAIYKANIGKAVDILQLPEALINDIFNQSYFNENTIVDMLLKYAMYEKDGKKWIAPMINIDQIVPFLQLVRKLVKDDLEVIKTDDGITVNKPITHFLNQNGTIAKDSEITAFLQKFKNKNDQIEKEIAASGAIPESRNWFNIETKNILSEKKEEETMDKMTMQHISNLAVGNILATRKEFVRPEQIQKVVDEEYPEGNINVTSSDEDRMPWDNDPDKYYDRQYQKEIGNEYPPEDSGIDQTFEREAVTPKYNNIIKESLN